MTWLNFLDSVDFLKKNNIEVLDIFVINSEIDLKKHINYPYVMKLSSELLHKTEEKAVIVDIFSQKKMIDSYIHLANILKKYNIKGKIILQEQKKGLELILGINKDEQFGKVVLFGQGGIYTEILNDTCVKILPITKTEINDMIFSTNISKLFNARGVVYGTEKLITLIEKIINISNKIQELDLNPIILTTEKIYIVDARVKLEENK